MLALADPVRPVFIGALRALNAHPLWFALVALIVLWLAYWMITQKWNPLYAAVGDDGRPSTSKFQFLVWTIPVLYVAIADFLTSFGAPNPNAGFSSNLLIVLGLSFATKVGAQGIAVGYVSKNPTMKTAPPAGATLDLSFLVKDDGGQIDLGKCQMLAWTFVAVATFLYAFFSNAHAYGMCAVNGPNKTMLCFPEISPTLMVLMGLSQGTYIGGKLAVSNALPKVDKISASAPAANAALTITLTGANLTDGDLKVNGVLCQTAWSGTSATVTVPNPLAGTDAAGAPTSTAIAAGAQLKLDGVINGVAFSSPVQL